MGAAGQSKNEPASDRPSAIVWIEPRLKAALSRSERAQPGPREPPREVSAAAVKYRLPGREPTPDLFDVYISQARFAPIPAVAAAFALSRSGHLAGDVRLLRQARHRGGNRNDPDQLGQGVFERVICSDVRFRFVIDMATL